MGRPCLMNIGDTPDVGGGERGRGGVISALLFLAFGTLVSTLWPRPKFTGNAVLMFNLLKKNIFSKWLIKIFVWVYQIMKMLQPVYKQVSLSFTGHLWGELKTQKNPQKWKTWLFALSCFLPKTISWMTSAWNSAGKLIKSRLFRLFFLFFIFF